ncbi:MAG: GTP-binding protein [Lachnospiraceae bacterium]|nr:GTP-binding protein [Lachnospiraceae bacterium]
MTRIDIISGFLGAGKTTLIKKLLKEALSGQKVVLIENEFGEIGVDGGFLKEAGIEIKEMNSGCICCSLVGDFGTSLKEVLETYHPERILIEPSGVGKLSDVAAAVTNVDFEEEVVLNSAVAVVDASKCKMYMKNFGEFFINQIEYAGTIVLSRTGNITEEKLNKAIELIREHNAEATIITTPWDELDGQVILDTMEKVSDMEQELLKEVKHHHAHHHHDHEEECECGCHEHHHGHYHHDHEEECECGCHEHHHEHHHHHDHEEECECGCHEHHHEHHHHDHEEKCDEEHHGHHHHDHGEECSCGCHGHHDHHGHHHADEVFTSWGKETHHSFSIEEIESILEALEDEKQYGFVLRAKGMVVDKDGGEWIYFDYVPGEPSVRRGKADVTGKLCVIGFKIQEDKLGELFGV